MPKTMVSAWSSAYDCGIKSVELIGYAKTLGIDFIVCDHHLPDKVISEAVAIPNPKQADCPYPYKELSGCGVGFKLMAALASHYSMPDETFHCYLDLVATAIAADIVPMTGENRILAYRGLIKINNNPVPGIKALIELGNIKKQLNITNVVFVIAPRVNARLSKGPNKLKSRFEYPFRQKILQIISTHLYKPRHIPQLQQFITTAQSTTTHSSIQA